MTQASTFDLPDQLTHKAAPQRSHQTGDAQGRVERETSVDHFRRRLRALQGYREDAVLGRMSPADGTPPVYVGRLIVHGVGRTPLLVDWRSPAAAPWWWTAGLALARRWSPCIAPPTCCTAIRGCALPAVGCWSSALITPAFTMWPTTVLETWLARNPEGTVAVISDPPLAQRSRSRVQALTPALAKGIEFDLVVLLAPESFGEGASGAVARYVAMTRSTRELVVLSSE